LSRGIKAGDLLDGKLTEEDEANCCGERGRERKGDIAAGRIQAH